MSNDLVVGAVIALLVIASVSYLVYQRRKGISSCGCKGCSRCKGSGSNVTIDEGGCDRCIVCHGSFRTAAPVTPHPVWAPRFITLFFVMIPWTLT